MQLRSQGADGPIGLDDRGGVADTVLHRSQLLARHPLENIHLPLFCRMLHGHRHKGFACPRGQENGDMHPEILQRVHPLQFRAQCSIGVIPRAVNPQRVGCPLRCHQLEHRIFPVLDQFQVFRSEAPVLQGGIGQLLQSQDLVRGIQLVKIFHCFNPRFLSYSPPASTAAGRRARWKTAWVGASSGCCHAGRCG